MMVFQPKQRPRSKKTRMVVAIQVVVVTLIFVCSVFNLVLLRTSNQTASLLNPTQLSEMPQQQLANPIVQALKPRNRQAVLVEPHALRSATETGIDVTDPSLYETTKVNGDSSTATVMALASGYGLDVYKRFVGSLRKSGFKGHIILGVAPDVSPQILDYFKTRNVTPKILKWVDCTYKKLKDDRDFFKKAKCSDPYPDIKIRWSRFPLARDWLRDCETCTGPVLVTDARDLVFQRDPFGEGIDSITGLQMYEEHVNQTTLHWLTKWPIGDCKGVYYNETMLCSGTTTGTRAAMLNYLEIMYQEMRSWIIDPKCRFNIDGDDQSIHNYLYYSGQLPFAQAIPMRGGGIVNTVGYLAAQMANQHFAKYKRERGLEKPEAKTIPYPGANDRTWIGTEMNLTTEDGLLTELDGSVSRVIHQWDRFHYNYETWLPRQPWSSD